jgi:hypothetical protein
MSRPYLSWSTAQLETEFERAQDSGDTKAVDAVVHELNFRTTARARALRQSVDRFLGIVRQPNDERQQKASATVAPQERSTTAHPQGSRLSPTDEQQQAIDRFRTGSSLKINAYAGTGKTSTLELLAESTTRRGQYIAFNRDIVRDAKDKFPSSVNCATTHGLAFKATPSRYKNNSDKMTKRLNANQLAEVLGFKRWTIDTKHTLEPRSQGYLVLETLRRFRTELRHATDLPGHAMETGHIARGRVRHGD